MAEAIAILGTIGAIANIVDATVKVASGLRELHNRWKDADFTLLNLIAQIIALKAALSKIEDWLSIDNDRQHHHQLVLDLDISLSCCKMLVDDMVAVVYQLNTDKYGALDMGSKIKVVLGDRKRSEYQKTIDIQISALTLVLSACTCATVSEQQMLLSKSRCRKTIIKMKDETSSLFARHDAVSNITPHTDGQSMISEVPSFGFERELFSSGVYRRNYRNSLLRWRKASGTTWRARPVPTRDAPSSEPFHTVKGSPFTEPDMAARDSKAVTQQHTTSFPATAAPDDESHVPVYVNKSTQTPIEEVRPELMRPGLRYSLEILGLGNHLGDFDKVSDCSTPVDDSSARSMSDSSALSDADTIVAHSGSCSIACRHDLQYPLEPVFNTKESVSDGTVLRVRPVITSYLRFVRTLRSGMRAGLGEDQ